uniref:GST N-terminal domain-containing protein n=1 Tax=Haplochromis burtoni TaxID=8153 RepID=A0A3Q2X8X3_HAPBU
MPMTLNHWDICRPAQPICILLEYTGEEHEDKYYEDKQSNAIIRYITRVVNIMMKQPLLSLHGSEISYNKHGFLYMCNRGSTSE